MKEKTMRNNNKTAHSSADYDREIRNTIPYYDSFHEESIRLVQALEINPGIWLDTGCGTGSFIIKAAGSFKNTHFILSDPSPSMLEIAKKKLSDCPEIHATVLEPAGSESLIHVLTGMPEGGIVSGNIEVITAIQSHHYYLKEARNKALEVCFRLLKEGGVFITFENIRPVTDKGIETGRILWRNFQISNGKSPENTYKHLNRFDREFFPVTVTEHLEMLRKAGFETAELFWYSYMQAGFYGLKYTGK